ncbi:hypothetical protein D8B34_26375 [Verminephrobacter eiseniae]|uniref:ABC-three component system protein n=2 Tax=Verminephrobacter eiseniae TaxID=364317 RepID=UPI0022371D23|nr:ABC-three component system protein [Verminephrobacter eiseniae]MCW5230493.1 hypothetical protein [Verminephrobacter eiseniae]MCW5292226.1 hypothetical protein [Verminephrobacter eiseniae]MCW8187944.1 hypothetical protein [Verminephrobacter eiseniae]MCW8226227.1 hypothetical protein [Verminephrobacter eiseniae]MCW8237088.1 hypothetical protein [Verminephrobacter eiseniae]
MATSKLGGSSRSKNRRTEVPGQALGYGLQYTRLTQLLLQAPAGSFCSMEYLDDVAQQQTDNSVRLIQSKSALTANPVADRAKSLWKTLSNWATLAKDSDCDLEKTVFEIYVSRPVGGQLVETFANACTLEEARMAIAQARDVLWGKLPDFALRSAVAKEIAPYIERVFNTDPTCLERIICNFQLTHGSGNPQADIEAVIRTHPVSATKVADIADHMCGVVKRRVDELLQAGRPAVIARDAFYEWYAAYLRKVDRDTVLPSRAKAPSEEESLGQLPKIFVQQLDLIRLPFEDKLEAASDYLMAAADRTAWAVSGEVDESSFDDLDATLKRSWKNKRRTCGIEHGSKFGEIQGQALYSDCMDFTTPLQAMQPPDHFIPGCFHQLADDMSIGWHPDYEQQLKVKKAA